MNAQQATALLAAARGYVFDVDGTLALADRHLSGYQPLPGAVELVSLLRQREVPCIAFTNGSTKTPVELAKALRAVGLSFEEATTLTPVSVAVDHFQRRRYQRVLVLGGEGVWRPLQDVGIEVVLAPERCDDADAVLIGWHPKFTLSDLDAAARAVWAGAKPYTVSNAAYVASREGRALGMSGALAAALRNVTGKRATVIGKPSTQAMNCASKRMGIAVQDLVVVGDDPSLETVMARRGGALSVAVHTGLASAEDFAALPEEIRPHLSIEGVHQLLQMVT